MNLNRSYVEPAARALAARAAGIVIEKILSGRCLSGISMQLAANEKTRPD